MSPKQDAVLWVAISDALEELATDATPEQVTDWLGRHRPQVKLETWLKADRGGKLRSWRNAAGGGGARVYLKTAGNRTDAKEETTKIRGVGT